MKWGEINYKQLLKLKENIDRLQSADMQKFCQDASKELAARLLSLVIPATPVGQYPKSTGKKGGTLRRGWTAKSYEEAMGRGGNKDAKAYAESLPVFKQGTNYYIEVINPVEYASYVEYGHRTPGGNGWVQGQYFLTLSERELEKVAPKVLEKKLTELLREVFNV